MEESGQAHAPTAWPVSKASWFPLNRKLGWMRRQPVHFREKPLVLSGTKPHTVQLTAYLLYKLHCLSIQHRYIIFNSAFCLNKVPLSCLVSHHIICQVLNCKKFTSIWHRCNMWGGGKCPSKFVICKDSFFLTTEFKRGK